MMKTALALLLLTGCATTTAPTRFADDLDAALATARTRKLPLVVDVWAPW